MQLFARLKTNGFCTIIQRTMAVSLGGSSFVNNEKVFNDPIHGSVRLNPFLVSIIDTPQFQRLRYIKQLGGCSFVYPGATHTRFEHSIGVVHLAGKFIEKLRKRQPKELSEEVIDDDDVLCVEIAALCHDLGHSPFSHLWDDRFMPRCGSAWKHEQGSQDMFDYLINTNSNVKEMLERRFKNSQHYHKRIQLVKDLIKPRINYSKKNGPNWPSSEEDKKKSFLFEIVANQRNGMDVDKWDYFKRDCHYLGIPCSFNIDRAMEFARVIPETKDGLWQICYRDKEIGNIYHMFQARLSLHQAAYQHKTKNAIECMITDALVKANNTLRIHGKDEHGQPQQSKMSECVNNMCVYTNLTDDIIQRILESPSTDEDMKTAKELLERIRTRDLYKLIGEVQVIVDTPQDDRKKEMEDIDKKKKEIIQQIVNISSQSEVKLDENDLEGDLAIFSFGKKKSNPVKAIRFYTKKEPNKAIKMPPESASKMLPQDIFEEKFIRFYCKSSQIVAEAERYFREWSKSNINPSTTPAIQVIVVGPVHLMGNLKSSSIVPSK